MPSMSALPGQPRAAGRLARSPQLAAALVTRLTARDRWLLRMLQEHRVLTTGQITQLAFGTTRAATARLAVLYQYRAVDRFRPLAAAGSSPLHFVLDEAGALLLAAEDGITPAELGYRRDRSMTIALSPRLAHDTGANGVFTALAAAARASGGQAGLECWWGERRCAAAWGEHARPDGYGRWTEQAPAAWLARLQPMAAASLEPTLAQAAGDRGVLAQRAAAAREVAVATVTGLAITGLTPGSVTVTVTAAQVITGSSGTSRSSAGWAVTLTPAGSGWVVWDIEPADAGNS